MTEHRDDPDAPIGLCGVVFLFLLMGVGIWVGASIGPHFSPYGDKDFYTFLGGAAGVLGGAVAALALLIVAKHIGVGMSWRAPEIHEPQVWVPRRRRKRASAAPQLGIEARPRGEAECPLCRDALERGAPSLACGACGVAVHLACAHEMGVETCPVPGCAQTLRRVSS